MAHEIDELSLKNAIFKETAGCQAGNGLGQVLRMFLPRNQRRSRGFVPWQVIFHAKVAQALSGMALVAMLLSTFAARRSTYSQQPPAGPNPDPDIASSPCLIPNING